MNIGFFIFIIIVVALIVSIISKISFKNKCKSYFNAMDNKYLSLGFRKIYEGSKEHLYINELTKQFAYTNIEGIDFIQNFNNVLNCEIIEDGYTNMSTTSKQKSSIGGALVGGAVFGPTGAIIGANNGKVISSTTVNNICKELKCKVTINSFQCPCFYINMLRDSCNKNSNSYHEAYKNAQTLLSIFQIMINSD